MAGSDLSHTVPVPLIIGC